MALQAAQTKLWPSFTRGIDRRQAVDQLRDGFAAGVTNMRAGALEALSTDFGYEARGGNTTLRGDPLWVGQHSFNIGVTETLLVTTVTFYKYASSPDEWHYVAGPVNTTLAADAPSTQTYVDVDDSTGLSDNDYIGIALDDGTQHQTQVSGSPSVGGGAGGSDRVNLDDALPGDATTGNKVVEPVTLTGSTSLPVSTVPWKPDDWFVFNNGADEPQKYDGTTVADVTGVSGISLTAATWVTAIHNQLFLGPGTTEGGTSYPSRIRRCVIGDGTDWSTSASGAGYEDIPEAIGVGRRAEPLGDDLALYFADGICLYRLINTDGALWRYELKVSGCGMAAAQALVNLGGTHYLLCSCDVDVFTGGPSLSPMGERGSILAAPAARSAVQNILYGLNADASASTMTKALMLHVPQLGEIWLIYPGADTNVNKVLRYSLQTLGWTERTFPGDYTNGGIVPRTTGLTWDEISTTWDTMQGTWDSLGASTVELWLCKTNSGAGTVQAYTPLASDDGGTAIEWSLALSEVHAPPNNIRVNWLDVLASGGAFVVELSEDGGASWTAYGTGTPTGGSLTRVRVHINKTCAAARLRLSGTASTRVGWAALTYQIESEVP